ncbi:hypothetical protein BH11ARM2_BH11ARM2_12520 [soil metagenome]
MKTRLAVLAFCLALAPWAGAHDIWVEPSSNVVRAGDWLNLSLMLGNHGNEHRDFRLASKVGDGDQSLVAYGPKGTKIDLTPSLVDEGYTPQEGFWSARYQPEAPGLYLAASTMDKVMSYAPVRDIRSAKTFFVASRSLDGVPEKNPGYDRVLSHPLELVPVVNPITRFDAGSTFRVRLLYKGKALPNTKVSFIPR